jgi:SNF2 family DNA or RNA helicase
VIDRVLRDRITLMPGGKVLLATMKANGAYAALVSGGFTAFTARIAAVLGFDENRANTLLTDGETLSGEVGMPILGKQAKLDALEEIVDQGEPVLCFTAYVHDYDRIKARFPHAVKFDGEPSLRAWQAGQIKLLVMHPASGGHGVDGLQVGGNVAVWFGLPYSLDLYEQANARLHRPGQANSVVVHHIVAVGTIDERIVQVLQAKGDMQQALIDAVRNR